MMQKILKEGLPTWVHQKIICQKNLKTSDILFVHYNLDQDCKSTMMAFETILSIRAGIIII